MLWQPGAHAAISPRGANIYELSCVKGLVHGAPKLRLRARQGGASLGERLFATRRLTLDLAAPLSDADATIQPFPDASPAKWHLAHTTWFFETFILRDHVPGYRLFDERWPILFNSYYEGEGAAPRAAASAGCSAGRRSMRCAAIAPMSMRRSSGRCRLCRPPRSN